MSYLDKIVTLKRQEIAERKRLLPASVLENTSLFAGPVMSLKRFLVAPNSSGIIAEFKRMSPSQGLINREAEVVPTTNAYVRAGAAALSVLTDRAQRPRACPSRSRGALRPFGLMAE